MGSNLTFSLDPQQLTQAKILHLLQTGQSYEPETTELAISLLEPGDTFIDIGAHVGWFSLLASRVVGESGRVFSFEPEANNFSRLIENIRINDCKNVQPIFMAVSGKDSFLDFYINMDNDGGHCFWNCGLDEFNEKSRQNPVVTKTMTVSIDTFLGNWFSRPIKLMKIDTEGAELNVIHGACASLSMHKIEHVIAEMHTNGLEVLGGSEAEFRGTMKRYGYQSKDIDNKQDGFVYNVHFYLED